jgi:signal transduction histidine kinase
MDFHPILSRIIKKTKVEIDESNQPFMLFLESINRSLHSNDREREISEHAFDVSESEYQNINNTLKLEDEQKNEFILKLKKTIFELEEDKSSVDFNAETKNLSLILDHLQALVVKQKKTETDLIKAKLIAEKAAAAKSDFLSVMSHEIRTPLNAIIGIAGLLKEKQSVALNEENINALKFSSEHLLYLINDILDFSKLEEGGINFQENDIHLKNLVQDIAQMSSYKANEKNTTIKVEIDNAIPEFVLGDVLRLKQVLSNLISNAVKFSEEGNVLINAKLVHIENEIIKVKFEIQDDGIGIAEDKQKEIFEKFTQAENSITSDYGGTGLGLAITRKILRLQGSDIFVASEIDKGSTFYFTLLFKESCQSKKIKNTNNIGGTNDLQGANILLVDDNKLNLLIAKQFLNKWKAKVTTCQSGFEAIDQVSKSNFDLILMDLKMPGMDGFEASSAIHKAKPTIPIIALTASSTNEIKDMVKQSMMCDFIQKPFDADEMFISISKHLKI